MKKILVFLTGILLLGSCEKKVEQAASENTSRSGSGISVMRREEGSDCVVPVTTDLVTTSASGEELIKGRVTIFNDNDYLYVSAEAVEANSNIISVQLLYGDAPLMNNPKQYTADGATALASPQVN